MQTYHDVCALATAFCFILIGRTSALRIGELANRILQRFVRDMVCRCLVGFHPFRPCLTPRLLSLRNAKTISSYSDCSRVCRLVFGGQSQFNPDGKTVEIVLTNLLTEWGVLTRSAWDSKACLDLHLRHAVCQLRQRLLVWDIRRNLCLGTDHSTD